MKSAKEDSMTLEQETRDAVAELGQSIMDIVNDDL
jgi:hypothetical protein